MTSLGRSAYIYLFFSDKKKDEGIIAKLGLNDWKVAVPVAVALTVPTIMGDVSILQNMRQFYYYSKSII